MEKEQNKGLIQIYTGNGKGKSTAAFGLALRASGCGMKTVIIQFMKKGDWYGEVKSFRLLPEVELYSYGGEKFIRKEEMPDQENIDLANQALNKAFEVFSDSSVDILILDELCNAVYFNLLSEEKALSLMKSKPEALELVITGRNATDEMIKLADLVTEMREIKHPYEKGVPARRGIEF